MISDALSVAQGAALGGIGVLVNLFGDDTYSATTSSSGTQTLIRQGDARQVASPFVPISAFIDAGGADTYGPGAVCQSDGGTPPAWVVWGTAGCGAQPGTVIIGIDALTGIGL